MLEAAAAMGLLVIAAYLALGVAFALPFLLFGVGRIDPATRSAPWTFRILVLPGVVALWPLLMRLWIRSGSRR